MRRVPSTTRSRPARSSVVLTCSYPSSPSSPSTRGESPAATSSTSAPPGAARRARRARRPPSPPRRRAPLAAPSRAPRARASRAPPGRTYGGFETTRSHGPSGRPVNRSHSRSSIARPVRTAFAPATSSASGRRVDAGDARTRMLVRDRERDRAAPRSDVEDARARRGPAIRARQRSTTTSVSGRGTSTRRSTLSTSRRKPHSPST